MAKIKTFQRFDLDFDSIRSEFVGVELEEQAESLINELRLRSFKVLESTSKFCDFPESILLGVNNSGYEKQLNEVIKHIGAENLGIKYNPADVYLERGSLE